ncbi:MAG: hypothetical protein DRI46_09125 [Chloroflexi bacterium]|nr:MAG: hypothetical protein DRI46_09125 [Chloroflexota bacterium]
MADQDINAIIKTNLDFVGGKVNTKSIEKILMQALGQIQTPDMIISPNVGVNTKKLEKQVSLARQKIHRIISDAAEFKKAEFNEGGFAYNLGQEYGDRPLGENIFAEGDFKQKDLQKVKDLADNMQKVDRLLAAQTKDSKRFAKPTFKQDLEFYQKNIGKLGLDNVDTLATELDKRRRSGGRSTENRVKDLQAYNAVLSQQAKLASEVTKEFSKIAKEAPELLQEPEVLSKKIADAAKSSAKLNQPFTSQKETQKAEAAARVAADRMRDEALVENAGHDKKEFQRLSKMRDDALRLNELFDKDKQAAQDRMRDSALSENATFDKKEAKRLKKLHVQAITEDNKRTQAAADAKDRMRDAALVQNAVHDKAAAKRLNKLHTQAIIEDKKRTEAAQDAQSRMRDSALVLDAQFNKKKAKRLNKLHTQAIIEDKKRTEAAANSTARMRDAALVQNAVHDKKEAKRLSDKHSNALAMNREFNKKIVDTNARMRDQALVQNATHDKKAAERLSNKHSKALAMNEDFNKKAAAQTAKQDAINAQRRQAVKRIEEVGGHAGVSRLNKNELISVKKGLALEEKALLQERAKLLVQQDKLAEAGKQSGKQYAKNDIAMRKLDSSISHTGKSMAALTQKMSKFGSVAQQASALFRQFFRFAIGYGALFQLLTAVSALTKSISGLNRELISIQAVTQATNHEMTAIEASIKQVALTTKFTTEEIAKAGKILGQAGVLPQEFPTALEAVATFASATDSALDIAADLVTTMRNVFTELEDVTISNQLTKAVNISKLTATDLKTILSISAQTAKKFNLSSEQYLAAAATLRDAGIKASTIATGFRRASNELFSLDKKSIDAFKKRYVAINEEMTEDAIKARFFGFSQADNPLVSALEELKRLGFSGSGKQELARVFDIRAVNVITALVDKLDDLKGAEAGITFGSAAAEGAEVQMRSLSNSLDNLGAAFTVLGDSVAGDGVNALESFVDVATRAITAVSELNDELKVTTGDGLGAATGPGALATILAFSATKGLSTAPRVLASLSAGAVTGGAAVAGEAAGLDQTTETLNGLLTGAFIISAINGIIKLLSKKLESIAKIGAVTAVDKIIKGIAGPIKGAFNVLVKGLKIHPVAGRVVALVTLMGSVMYFLSRTAEEQTKELRDKARQAQENYFRQKSKTDKVLKSIAEFDLADVKGTAAGTTARSFETLLDNIKNLDAKINEYVEEKAESVVDINSALEDFLTATGGDSGALNFEEQLKSLKDTTGFSGTGRQAIETANLDQTVKSSVIAFAEQIKNSIDKTFEQVQLAGGSTEGLKSGQLAEFEGFSKFLSTDSGLKFLTNLQFVEQADVKSLTNQIGELIQAISEATKRQKEDALNSLGSSAAQRDESVSQQLGKQEISSAGEITRILDANAALNADGTPKSLLESRQRITGVINRAIEIANAEIESLKFLPGKMTETAVAVQRRNDLINEQARNEEKIKKAQKQLELSIEERVKAAVILKEDVGKAFPSFEDDSVFSELPASAQDKVRESLALSDDELAERVNLFESVKSLVAAVNQADDSVTEFSQDEIDAAIQANELAKQRTSAVLTDKVLRKELADRQRDIISALEDELEITKESLFQESGVGEEADEIKQELLDIEKRIALEKGKQLIPSRNITTLIDQQLETEKVLLAIAIDKVRIEKKISKQDAAELVSKQKTVQALISRDKASQTENARRIKEESNADRLEAIQERGRPDSFNDLTKEFRLQGDLRDAKAALEKGDLNEAQRLSEKALSTAEGLKNRLASEFNFTKAANLSNQVATELAKVDQAKAQLDTKIAQRAAIQGGDAESLVLLNPSLSLEDAEKQIEDFKLKSAKQDYEIALKVATDKAFSDIDTLTARILGIPDKTVVITVVTKKEGDNEFTTGFEDQNTSEETQTFPDTVRNRYATTNDRGLFRIDTDARAKEIVAGGGGKSRGGSIPGYGGGDVVPTALEPGEEVIRKERAVRFREVLKTINNAPVSQVRKMVSGMEQKFRNGGTVQPASSFVSSGKSGSPVYLQLPSGEQAGPLYGDADAVAAMKRMLARQVTKTTRRRR